MKLSERLHKWAVNKVERDFADKAAQLEADNERLKQQNGLLRQRLRYYGVGLIKEADKFDALKEVDDES